eukprot:CAMPEP_0176166000 /NCGR_PEP_ID=MMETSP0120_2-20121206/84899_1 /TAXON_ID=160619 /ORGANISM="Kryptoperidinium foliaceum, Strain CCMP 1326" /LENGTH=180 /DNA_ID=CAMNT_0017503531 /DNA_START=77 /DNA_END=616 /DNA_ORIENTATION=-
MSMNAARLGLAIASMQPFNPQARFAQARPPRHLDAPRLPKAVEDLVAHVRHAALLQALPQQSSQDRGIEEVAARALNDEEHVLTLFVEVKQLFAGSLAFLLEGLGADLRIQAIAQLSDRYEQRVLEQQRSPGLVYTARLNWTGKLFMICPSPKEAPSPAFMDSFHSRYFRTRVERLELIR